jgi:hypothetical protein
MTDLVRKNNNMQKKGICVFAAGIVEGTADGNVSSAAGNHLLGYLPPDSLVLATHIQVQTVSDAATSASATVGTASAGAQLMTGANLKTAGKQGTAVAGVETGTGVPIWLNVSKAGGVTDVAKYLVYIEYLEYEKNTGEYTKLA